MSSTHFWLSDKQFARLEPHLPTDTRGKPRVDDRRVISGIIHVLKSGCRWADAPEVYGPRKTLYNRFVMTATLYGGRLRLWARRRTSRQRSIAAGKTVSRPSSIATGTPLNACLAGSRTSGALQPVTTSSLKTSYPLSVSSLQSAIGYESGP